MTTKFEESSIPQNYAQYVSSAYNLRIEPVWAKPIAETLFESITQHLKNIKEKGKSAIRIDDKDGNFLIAGVVDYHDNDDAELPGNYSYEFTTNEEDIQNAQKVSKVTDMEFLNTASIVGTNHSMVFEKETDIIQLTSGVLKTIIGWLDSNAVEGQEVSVELDGYFVATVGVEDGEKIISIVPDGAMKRIIKDDASIEK